jgi:hypothetical protein
MSANFRVPLLVQLVAENIILGGTWGQRSLEVWGSGGFVGQISVRLRRDESGDSVYQKALVFATLLEYLKARWR